MFHPEQETFNQLRGLDFEGYNIPEHTKFTLENYFYHGIDPGSFIGFMLRGNLNGATWLADEENRLALDDIRRFIEDQIPLEIRDNSENIKAWIYGKSQKYL